jgi:hypothetical protein
MKKSKGNTRNKKILTEMKNAFDRFISRKESVSSDMSIAGGGVYNLIVEYT